MLIRALLYEQARINMEAPEDTSLDFSTVPHVAGVPRYMFRNSLRTFLHMLREGVRRDVEARFERELELWFFAGVVGQRWKDRKAKTGGLASKAGAAEIR